MRVCRVGGAGRRGGVDGERQGGVEGSGGGALEDEGYGGVICMDVSNESGCH